MASVISFRIDDEDRDLLQQYAEQFDATLSWAARRAIKDFTAKLAKESKNGEGDYLLTESNGTISETGACPSGNNTESQECKI